jgi:DNA-binding NarL/FixJ family response regulator
LGPTRILIVDDFEPWRRSLYSLLEQANDLEIVSEASDGLEALEKCEQLEPDLILLDMQLPKMNGLDVAREVSERFPSMKILFLSAGQTQEVIKEALKIGSGFVVKSHAARDLLPALRAIIRDEPFLRFSVLEDLSSE